MKRKFILILISLIIVGAAAFFYIDTVFLPVQFKRYVTSRAEKLLNRKVSIGAIDFKIFQGFILENITVARKDDPNQSFFKSKKITFNLLLTPFFQKKAIIPSIKIDEPFVYLVHDKKGNWNFSDLLDLRRSSGRGDLPSILLRKLHLKGGIIHFTDKTQKEIFSESIENIHLTVTLSLNQGIRFIAEARSPELKSVIKVKGNHDIVTRKLTAQITANNIHLARYLTLIKPSQSYFHLDRGIISEADLGVTYKDRKFQVQGIFDVKDADILIGQDKRMSGSLHVSDMLFTWFGQKWDVAGRMELLDIQLTSTSGKKFRGNVTADLSSLTISGISIASKGDVTINKAHFEIDDNRYLKGNITATNASLSKIDDAIELKGDVDIRETFIAVSDQVTMGGHLSTTKAKLMWSSPDSRGNRKFDIQGGLQINSAFLTIGKNQFISENISAPKASLVYNLKKITAKAQGQLNKTHIQLEADQEFRGSPHFNIFYQYDFNSSNPVDYEGTLHFTESQLDGIPIVENIHAIEGTVTVMPNRIQTNELTFNTQDTHIRLSGLLTDFRKLNLDIKASSDNIEFKNIFTLFPNLKKKINGDIIGSAVVQASYIGPALSPSDADIESTAQVSGATIMLNGSADDITNVSGQLEYKTDLLIWNNLLANYKSRSYTLNGRLVNFSRPVINTTVSAEQLSLTARIKILHQAFQLTEFVGDYLNSSFDLKGDVHLFEDADADIDLRGKITLNLKDIGMLAPRLKKAVAPFNFVGILTGEGLYKGTLNDWRNWQLVVNAESNKIMIKNYPFENVTLHFTQRDNTINKYNISSTIYGGTLNLTSSADLRGADVPFTATMTLENLDLKRLRENQKLKNKDLAGILNLSSSLKGDGKKWRQLTGEGSFSVSEGRLWQWNILHGLSGILLIPEFKILAFTEASGNFTIHDQKIHTENTRMIGNKATLDGKGWIDFDKNLNFDIKPTFSKLAILQSNSIRKKPTSIFTQTDGYINIKLTGTLDNPHFSVKKFPLKIIEETIGGTTDTLKEVIGSIIEEVFK